MKVVVTAQGNEPSCLLEERFGRTRWLILVDTADDSWQAYPNNQNNHAAQGAGIQTAQQVVSLDAKAVITGHVGPKAFRILNISDIGVFLGQERTVAETIECFKRGALQEVTKADVEGHWA